MRYEAPAITCTGTPGMQPPTEARRSDWHFDQALNYTPTGFLDAPEWVPCGSVRALECSQLVLGVAQQRRTAEVCP